MINVWENNFVKAILQDRIRNYVLVRTCICFEEYGFVLVKICEICSFMDMFGDSTEQWYALHVVWLNLLNYAAF